MGYFGQHVASLSFVGAGAGLVWALDRTMWTIVAIILALLFFLHGGLGQSVTSLSFVGAGGGLRRALKRTADHCCNSFCIAVFFVAWSLEPSCGFLAFRVSCS